MPPLSLSLDATRAAASSGSIGLQDPCGWFAASVRLATSPTQKRDSLQISAQKGLTPLICRGIPRCKLRRRGHLCIVRFEMMYKKRLSIRLQMK